MNTINRTFSIPKDLDEELHMFIPQRGMSRFVSDSLRSALKEKSEQLAKDYSEAWANEEQRDVIKDWDCTLTDGLEDEKNEW